MRLLPRLSARRPTAAALVVCTLASQAAEARKSALIIVNENYQGDLPALPGAQEESHALATTLKAIGFEVQHGKEYVNLSQARMRAVIKEFAGGLQPGDWAIVAYSGHGMAIGDENFLIPTDGDAVDASGNVGLDDELVATVATKAAFSAFFVDACRNKTAGKGGGFGRPRAGSHAFIMFSAKLGRLASNNSGFIRSLAERLAEPGERLEDIAKEVASDVARKTNDSQTPEIAYTLDADIVLRRAAQVSLTDVAADDALKVLVDNKLFCDTSAGSCAEQPLELKKGAHHVLLKVFNKRSFTGGVRAFGGHQPEGWWYRATFSADGVKLLDLKGGEDRPDENGPHFDATFDVARFDLIVDPKTSAVRVQR